MTAEGARHEAEPQVPELGPVGDEVDLGDLAVCHGEPEDAQGLVPGVVEGSWGAVDRDGDRVGQEAWRRVFARRERPHPGAQLSLLEAADGWRYCLWVTNLPAATKGWRGQCAYLDAAHRVHARVEDFIRTGKDTGLGHFPSHDYKVNQAWLDASMIACILLSWLKLLALDGDLAKAEPKTLRRRPARAARLVRGGRRRCLKIAATWPWAEEIVTAWYRVQAIPHST